MANIKLVEDILNGDIPPIEVKVQRQGLIEVAIAVIAVAFVIKLIWKK
ncbi:MAG: hypothetical protein H6553_06660 [Chitinophagales bacterium]|nr:hypothetical protein [Chitinophagales bacterium]